MKLLLPLLFYVGPLYPDCPLHPDSPILSRLLPCANALPAHSDAATGATAAPAQAQTSRNGQHPLTSHPNEAGSRDQASLNSSSNSERLGLCANQCRFKCGANRTGASERLSFTTAEAKTSEKSNSREFAGNSHHHLRGTSLSLPNVIMLIMDQERAWNTLPSGFGITDAVSERPNPSTTDGVTADAVRDTIGSTGTTVAELATVDSRDKLEFANVGDQSGTANTDSTVFRITSNTISPWFRENLPWRTSLYQNSVSFDNHLISTAPCKNSRMVLFTGQHFQRTGVQDQQKDDRDNLPPGIPTIGNLMQVLGYKTAYKGKWHGTSLQEIFADAVHKRYAKDIFAVAVHKRNVKRTGTGNGSSRSNANAGTNQAVADTVSSDSMLDSISESFGLGSEQIEQATQNALEKTVSASSFEPRPTAAKTASTTSISYESPQEWWNRLMEKGTINRPFTPTQYKFIRRFEQFFKPENKSTTWEEYLDNTDSDQESSSADLTANIAYRTRKGAWVSSLRDFGFAEGVEDGGNLNIGEDSTVSANAVGFLSDIQLEKMVVEFIRREGELKLQELEQAWSRGEGGLRSEAAADNDYADCSEVVCEECESESDSQGVGEHQERETLIQKEGNPSSHPKPKPFFLVSSSTNPHDIMDYFLHDGVAAGRNTIEECVRGKVVSPDGGKLCDEATREIYRRDNVGGGEDEDKNRFRNLQKWFAEPDVATTGPKTSNSENTSDASFPNGATDPFKRSNSQPEVDWTSAENANNLKNTNFYLNLLRDTDRHIGRVLESVFEYSKKGIELSESGDGSLSDNARSDNDNTRLREESDSDDPLNNQKHANLNNRRIHPRTSRVGRQMRDTIVIFTSDHGEMLGEYGRHGKGPILLKGNMRVPFLVAEVKAGSGKLSVPEEFDFLSDEPLSFPQESGVTAVSPGSLTADVDVIKTIVGLVRGRMGVIRTETGKAKTEEMNSVNPESNREAIANESDPPLIIRGDDWNVTLSDYLKNLPGIDLSDPHVPRPPSQSPRSPGARSHLFQYTSGTYQVPESIPYHFLQGVVVDRREVAKKGLWICQGERGDCENGEGIGVAGENSNTFGTTARSAWKQVSLPGPQNTLKSTTTNIGYGRALPYRDLMKINPPYYYRVQEYFETEDDGRLFRTEANANGNYDESGGGANPAKSKAITKTPQVPKLLYEQITEEEDTKTIDFLIQNELDRSASTYDRTVVDEILVPDSRGGGRWPIQEFEIAGRSEGADENDNDTDNYNGTDNNSATLRLSKRQQILKRLQKILIDTRRKLKAGEIESDETGGLDVFRAQAPAFVDVFLEGERKMRQVARKMIKKENAAEKGATAEPEHTKADDIQGEASITRVKEDVIIYS